MSQSKRFPRAFTLVELLTVIAIISVLVTIMIPYLGQARELVYRTRCLGNMRAIGGAVVAYADVYRALPPSGLAPIVAGPSGLTYGSPYVWWFEKPMLGQFMGCDIPHSPGTPPKGTPVKCPSAARDPIDTNPDGSLRYPKPEDSWIGWSWYTIPWPGYQPPGSPMHRVYYRGPKWEEFRNPASQVPIYYDCRGFSGLYICAEELKLNPATFSAADHRHNGGVNYLFADNRAQYIANPDLYYLQGNFKQP